MSLARIVIVSFIFYSYRHIGETEGKSNDELQCRDENNRAVDWFVMYKLPKIGMSSEPLIRKGVSYLYMTSETVATGWKLSRKDVSSANSIPGYTLSALYDDNASDAAMWLLYNDQPPKRGSYAKYGHAKGVAMTNREGGFWLIHSVPGFPAVPKAGEESRRRNGKASSTATAEPSPDQKDDIPDGKYGYPESGKHYGQSFMCITINSHQIDNVARQLMYNQAIIYRKNVPDSLVQRYPVFVNASNRMRIRNPPYNRKTLIKSLAGVEFTSFAKSDKWQKELYDDWVGPQLNSDLLAETWRNGRGKLPSECNGTRVQNVESIALREANVDFTSSHDHSKWAISTTGKKGKWLCVGDINRADTQFNRGGGTVCIDSQDLWINYKNAVNDVEPCPKKRPGFIQRMKNWFTAKMG